MPYSLIYNNGTATTTYYYITNLQGDVMYLVDADGNEVAAYDYDPYGKVISSTGDLAKINPLRYRGYYYDTETGFYYLQSRYYDPEICRFINADGYASTGQGLLGYNAFAYCGNNPVINADAEGDFWHIVIGAAIGGITSYVSSRLSGNSVKESLVSAAFGTASGALCAAFPAAAIAIDAGFAAAESITVGTMKGESIGEIATDTIVSVGFSVLTCGRGNTLADASTYVALKETRTAVKSAYRPALKLAAKKQVKKVLKRIAKKTFLEFGEYAIETAMEEGVNIYVKRAFRIKEVK